MVTKREKSRLRLEGAIKNFEEEIAVNIISNTFTTNDSATGFINNQNPNFNPLDKVVQLFEDKVALMERLLESEKEKVEMLMRMVGK